LERDSIRHLHGDFRLGRRRLLDPGAKRVKGFQPIMPTFQGLVSEEQVNALVAYIKSISEAKPAAGVKTNASFAAPAPPNQIQAQADVKAQAQPNAQPNRSQVRGGRFIYSLCGDLSFSWSESSGLAVALRCRWERWR
jgi:hypothetical protein